MIPTPTIDKEPEIISDHVMLENLFNEQINLKARVEELYEQWQELESQKLI